MSGYSRTGAAAKRIVDVAPVVTLISEPDVARIAREQDPFGLAHGCSNPAGHQPTASCGEIVCVHCARIFWR